MITAMAVTESFNVKKITPVREEKAGAHQKH
jgi:hypothetical protein